MRGKLWGGFIMFSRALIVALSAVLISACGDSSSSVSNIVERRVEVPFDAVVGSTVIKCGVPLTNLGTQNSSGTMTDFRFFVHDLRVVLNNGKIIPVDLDENAMQTDNIAMIDLRDKLSDCEGESNSNYHNKLTGTIVLDSAEIDEISELIFGLGVPHSHNHSDQSLASGPLKNPGIATGMTWAWRLGYKFTGLDIKMDTPIERPVEGSAPQTYAKWLFHIGSIDCIGDSPWGESVSCTYPNRRDIRLSGYQLNQKKVRLDYQELMSDSDLTQDVAGAAGCMSAATDPECEKPFAKFGLVHPLSGGDPQVLPEQTVFSLVGR